MNIYNIELKHIAADIADTDPHNQPLYVFQTDSQFCIYFYPLPQYPYG